jgi:bifunctional ADP-heptose synthase (sugar kinase/adenylyltransferase)
MKKNTLKIVRNMMKLIKKYEAYFFKDEKGKTFYTYRRAGWVKPAKIDGKVLEYVDEHDNVYVGITSPIPNWEGVKAGKPILAKVGEL